MVEGIILKKIRTQEELTLDMVSTPDFILKSVDWGTIQSSHHSYKYVNQIGVSVTNTSLETRAISIIGWVIADTEKEMTNRKSILNGFFNPQDMIELIYEDYLISFIPDETVKYSIALEENNEVICKFQIKGTCPNPLFQNSYESRVTIAATIANFHFPLIMSKNLYPKGAIFGYRTNSLIAKITNKGAVDIGMRIVFKAKGVVENPKLINVNTGEEFKINKTMASEEEIEINTNVGEKSVRGKINNADFTNYFMYKDIDSVWLQLKLGENLFRYDADNGLDNLEVFVYFHNKFLEVQECY